MLQRENGLTRIGPLPYEGDEDADQINAGEQTVIVVDGGVIVDSTEAFGMIRGGHITVAILGAMQVSANGDPPNWVILESLVKRIGGAMD